MGEEIFFSDEDVTLVNFFFKTTICNYFLMIMNYRLMNPKLLNVEPWINNYNTIQFFHLFRMKKESFCKLMEDVARIDNNKILSRRYHGGHHPIDIKGHVLIFLWYMATQDTLLSIGTRFNVSPTTVMNVVNKMLYLVIKLKTRYIRFPQCEQELIDVSHGFKNYPGMYV